MARRLKNAIEELKEQVQGINPVEVKIRLPEWLLDFQSGKRKAANTAVEETEKTPDQALEEVCDVCNSGVLRKLYTRSGKEVNQCSNPKCLTLY